MTDGYQIHDHFVLYLIIKSLCFTPETNNIVHQLYFNQLINKQITKYVRWYSLLRRKIKQEKDTCSLCFHISNPDFSILNNISILSTWMNPDYSLKRLMLKLQYCGHLMQIADSLEKTDAGKIKGMRRRGQQRMRRLDGIIDSMDTEFEQAPGDGEGQ